MSTLLNFFGLGKKKYPQMDYDVKGEGIIYSLPDRKVYIAWTHIDGQRIYTDSIDDWDNGDKLAQTEKAAIFADIVPYMRKQTKEKLIIVINIDFDKTFWQNECEKLKVDIKLIEYTSEKEKDDLSYQMFLQAIPNLTIEGTKINSKEDLDNYWATRKRRNILVKFD